MDVAEAADQLGVTSRRVRALISEGKIPAHRVGAKWSITALPVRRIRRPLSLASRQRLAKVLHSRSLKGLEGQALVRTADRVRQLRESDSPARLLLDWWGGKPDEKDVYVRNLLQRALAGDEDGVRDELRRRHPAYLSTRARLADRITAERRIRGLSAAQLADAAGVRAFIVRDLEKGRPIRSPGPSRRVLRALDIVPSALPPMGSAS